MKEEFREIKGFEGRYSVSNLGRVKSLPKSLGIPCSKKIRPEYILKSNIANNGYIRVNLGRGNMRNIHRLVAETFIQNPDNKPCVNHIDGNKLNSHISNLEWCTYKENSRHSFDTGLNTLQLQNLIHPPIKKVLNLLTNEVYDSMNDAARKLNIHPCRVRYYLNLNRGHVINLSFV